MEAGWVVSHQLALAEEACVAASGPQLARSCWRARCASLLASRSVGEVVYLGFLPTHALPVFLTQHAFSVFPLQYRKSFQRGHFHLGFLSVPIGIIAVTWVLFLTVSWLV